MSEMSREEINALDDMTLEELKSFNHFGERISKADTLNPAVIFAAGMRASRIPPENPIAWVRMVGGDIDWGDACISEKKQDLFYDPEEGRYPVPLYTAPPAQAVVPEELKSKLLDLCASIKSDYDLPPVEYSMETRRLVSEVEGILNA